MCETESSAGTPVVRSCFRLELFIKLCGQILATHDEDVVLPFLEQVYDGPVSNASSQIGCVVEVQGYLVYKNQ